MGRTPILVVAAVLATLLPGAPAAAEPVTYRPPVPGPVLDPYRPPDGPYGAGNRGIDFATTPGEPVVAPAAGDVTFAGAVGGGLHVVLLHADGIRTSLSFLAAILVRRGQRVGAGEPVGRAGSSLHFGARRGEAYLDPATLLGRATGGRAVLVPDGPEHALGAAEEADGIRRLLSGDRPVQAPAASRPPGAVAGKAPEPLRAVANAAMAASPPTAALALAAAARRRRRRSRASPTVGLG